ncbi:phage tail tip fiber protein [Methylibium petroleiphilum]
MSVPDIRSPSSITDPALRALLEEIRDNINTRSPEATSVGSPLEKFVTRAEMVRLGFPFANGQLGGNGGGGGGTTVVVPGGGTGGDTPDVTPPPTPTGLAVTAGMSYLLVTHASPTYTQGHGHDRTVVYGAKWPSGTAPTFVDAVRLFEFQGTIGAYPTDLGTRWCIWIKWQSVDGYESTSPAGGTNGAQATTGVVGTSDLGPAIVLAGNLAPGSVTADKAMLEIGGDNLLANSSFEVDADSNGLADGWAGYGTQQSPVYTRQTGRISGFCQRVAWTGTNTTTKGVTCDNGIGGGVRGGWKQGASYVVSFYARADTAKATGCALGWTNAPATSITIKNPTLATEWRRYAFRVVLGATVDANGGLRLTCTPSAAIAGWIEYDDVQVEEGDTLTAYTGKLALNSIVAGDGAIANLAILNANIANGAVDDLKVANISAAKFTAGDGTIGGPLKSSNFVAGSTGWRVLPNGTAEFSGVVVRGTVYATAGSIGGITMGASSIYSSNFVAGSDGFRLNSNGTLEANNAQLRGSINGGDFTGYAWPASGGTGYHLSATGLLMGNFNDGRYIRIDANGNMFAPGFNINNGAAKFTSVAVDAVDTPNVVQNAITLPVGAYTAGSTTGGTVQSVGITMDGSPIMALAGCTIENVTNAGFVVALTLRRGATIISTATAYIWPDSAGGVPVTLSMPPVRDQPAAGTYTYTLVTSGVVNSNLSVTNRGIVLMGAKR